MDTGFGRHVVGRFSPSRTISAPVDKVHEIVHKHGGKYLSRSGNINTVEGEPLNSTLVTQTEFPSMDAVQAFASDPEYAPHAKARQAGSISRLHVIDDTDAAGTIPYLPKP